MHLLYARFWTKVMADAGLITFDEPFKKLRNQGMLLAYTPGREIKRDDAVQGEGDGDEPIEDWKVLKKSERAEVPESEWVWRWVKMSKSLENVVTPDEMAEKYGADSLRLYGLFVAPFEETVQWTDSGIQNASKYLNRVWRIWTELRTHYEEGKREASAAKSAASGETADIAGDQNSLGWGEDERRLRRKLHQTIRKLGEDLEDFRFNTAVAALMEFTNELSAFRNALGGAAPTDVQAALIAEVLETLPLLMAPIAPHLADEFWERLGKTGYTFREKMARLRSGGGGGRRNYDCAANQRQNQRAPYRSRRNRRRGNRKISPCQRENRGGTDRQDDSQGDCGSGQTGQYRGGLTRLRTAGGNMITQEKIAVKPRMTEAEFMRMPDDGRKYELVDGEPKAVPAGIRHEALVIHIGAMLLPAAKGPGFVAGSSAGYRMVSPTISEALTCLSR